MKTKSLFAITFLFFVMIGTPVWAANWYVDNATTGSPSNGTSWANAWRSFSAIVWSGVNSGDSISISGGATSKTYTETLVVGKGGTTNYITIRTGQDAGHTGTVIIDGESGRNYGVTIAGKSYIRISGQIGSGSDCRMQVKNHRQSGIDASDSIQHLIFEYLEVNNNGSVENSHGMNIQPNFSANFDFEIRNCKIHNNWQDCIHAVQGTAGEGVQFGTVRIHDNDLYNVVDDGIETSLPCDIYNNKIRTRIVEGGPGHPDGIQFYNSYTRIFNNDVYDWVRSDDASANAAIYSDAFDPDITLNPHHIYIFNNRITETNMPFQGEYYRGIDIGLTEVGPTGGGHDIIVANNTIAGLPFHAIGLTLNDNIGTAAVSNIQIVNNVIKNCARTGWGYNILLLGQGDSTITFGSVGDGVDVTVDYNSLYSSSNILYGYKIYWNGSHEYTFSQFRTASGCQDHYIEIDPLIDVNYKPTSSSPLIDHGANLSAYFSTDKNGTARPQGSAWDIGAYEYVSSTQQQVINLTTGWNWISFNVLPTDLSLNSIFSGILGQVEQVKAQAQSAIRSGNAWKGDLANMNGINTGAMYKVKVSADCTLTVTGTAVPSATPILLVTGWNWVAYLPTTAMPLATALDSIKSQVQEVKSLTQSATYSNGAWSGTLTDLHPGQGYTIKMSAPGALTYPTQPK